MGAVGPGEEQLEEDLELLHVDAVLLQVGQAGVVALRGVAAAAPVAAGQVLCLQEDDDNCHTACKKKKQLKLSGTTREPAELEAKGVEKVQCVKFGLLT